MLKYNLPKKEQNKLTKKNTYKLTNIEKNQLDNYWKFIDVFNSDKDVLCKEVFQW